MAKIIKLISITQYSRLYKIDRHTVYKQIKDGKIQIFFCRHNSKQPNLNPNDLPKDIRKFEKRSGY